MYKAQNWTGKTIDWGKKKKSQKSCWAVAEAAQGSVESPSLERFKRLVDVALGDMG